MRPLPPFVRARRLQQRTLLRAVAAAWLGVALEIACAAEAPPAELKLSVAVGHALPLGKAAERWSQRLAEAGDAKVAAKVHAGAVLAARDPVREVAALKEGAADLAVGSALQWSLQLPALGVFTLPWIAPDHDALAALAANEPLRAALSQRLERQGIVLVAIAPLAHRELATTSRSIRAPADLAGLRVRASPMPMVHDTLLALGALPQAMGFAQAQAAFASGALDAQEGTPSALASVRTGASGQRNLTLWGAIGDAMIFAVRKSLWDGFTDAQRDAMRRTARQAIVDTDARAREEAAIRALSQNGMTVVRITPAGHEAFRTAVGDVLARWRGAIGDDIVKLADEALAQRQATPRAGS